ncbi:hypothetical protein D3C87_1111890 [compost metagenome]
MSNRWAAMKRPIKLIWMKLGSYFVGTIMSSYHTVSVSASTVPLLQRVRTMHRVHWIWLISSTNLERTINGQLQQESKVHWSEVTNLRITPFTNLYLPTMWTASSIFLWSVERYPMSLIRHIPSTFKSIIRSTIVSQICTTKMDMRWVT